MRLLDASSALVLGAPTTAMPAWSLYETALPKAWFSSRESGYIFQKYDSRLWMLS
eukprot:CAMPEP_0185762706 /NCGR_PEP_ID=MMETSP1174-20130828/21669_1 /TAXON_ID=35687 /ORGANISM="Dictyocha speculum, Strain CCMP1381" /LENGTH=54 /DNA_ID=CAMNT_0028444487 /DNA_START=60 /DNA_END=220 /DNA_ORIENTATION=-